MCAVIGWPVPGIQVLAGAPTQEPRGGCRRICASPLQPGPETALCIIPRNQPDGSAVDLLKTAVNLLAPYLFGVAVDFDIQAFEQRVGQSGAGFGRKRKRVPEQLRCIPWHEYIVSLCRSASFPYSWRTCAVETRSRSTASRLDRGVRPTALATAASQPAWPRRRTAV